ncbi:MAG: hypothetical protein OXT09_06925 [Myxococcales bacterium]|nr:hypothetical protein [Myxococcales bacterium]
MIVVLVGAQNLESIMRAMAAIPCHPEFEHGMDTVWDLRSADLSRVGSDEVRQSVDFARALDERRGIHCTALVAPAGLAFGLSRRYGVRADRGEDTMQLARGLDTAWSWTRESRQAVPRER